MGLQEISVLPQSARLLFTSTQVRDKIIIIYSDTAYMSLITVHEHVGHPSCGMYAYMVTGWVTMGKMLHLVLILYRVSHGAERTKARITDENHVYMFTSLAPPTRLRLRLHNDKLELLSN